MFTFTPMATLESLICLTPFMTQGGSWSTHTNTRRTSKCHTERCRQGELTGKKDIIFENLKGKNKTYDFVKHVSRLGSWCKTQFKGVPVSSLQRPVWWL